MAHLDNLRKLQEQENGVELEEQQDVSLPGGVVITEDTELAKDLPPQEEKVEAVAIEAQLGKAQEEADLVVTSRADLVAVIKDVVKAYDVKIEAATDRVDKLALIIEMQEKKANVGAPKKPGIRVSKRSHNVPDHQSILVEANKDKLKGKVGRFVNTRSNMRSLRRYQGYEPIIGGDGEEVRYMDGVLMAMPEKRHEEEIQKPREERKRFRAESIGAKFKEDAAKAGVEVIGDGITYDDEYDVPTEK